MRVQSGGQARLLEAARFAAKQCTKRKRRKVCNNNKSTETIDTDAATLNSNSAADTVPTQILQGNSVISGEQQQRVSQRYGQPETAMFNGPQMIIGGTFVQNVSSSGRRGFQLLEKRVATAAFHNSARRVDPPRCHPNTRIVIQKRIYDWIVMDLLIRRMWILWMHGAAGGGKSAIMQSIAELCEMAAIPLASFFFFRTDPTRNSTTSFIATLVYQLIQNIPLVQDEILGIIESNPLIFDQSLKSQLETLIIQPLCRAREYFKGFFVVLIDGLDKCIESAHQADLVKLLGTVSRSGTIPVIFLVASRREPQIEAAFVRKEVSDHVLTLPLDNSDIEQTSDDIRRFLVDKFRDIKEAHLFKRYLPIDWPPASSVEEIVTKSSGQFIFASVVINYLLSPRANPARQLEVIHGIRLRDPSTQHPFAHLDSLYEHIFSQVEALNKVLTIIGYVIASRVGLIKHIQKVFLLEDGELDVLFADLAAVILCKPPSQGIPELKFLHASLPDFLVDKSRSKRYHIDLDEYTTSLLCKFLKRDPPILDLLRSGDDLRAIIDQEQNRLRAIQNLLGKAKSSERLHSALMSFNCTLYGIEFLSQSTIFVGDNISPSILQCLKRLDFNDQGAAYHHVIGVFAAEYVQYWPLFSDFVTQSVERQSPDLFACIKEIQEQVNGFRLLREPATTAVIRRRKELFID